MDNIDIKKTLDDLTSRGVLSADGRRKMFEILATQAAEHNNAKRLLEEDVERLRAQSKSLQEKLQEVSALVPKTKLSK